MLLVTHQFVCLARRTILATRLILAVFWVAFRFQQTNPVSDLRQSRLSLFLSLTFASIVSPLSPLLC